MKSLFYTLAIAGLLICNSILAESAYIYDKDKGLWSRKGASREFAVEHKYPPGTKLQIIKGEVENGYTHVIDSRGRQSWIPSNYLLPTANVYLDKALNDIEKIKSDYKTKIKKLQADLRARAPLEQTNRNLQSKIAKMTSEMEQLRQSNSAISSRFNREVFFAGGLTIFVGIILGWIFGVRGRKGNSAWS